MLSEEATASRGITVDTMHAVGRGLLIGLGLWTLGPAVVLAGAIAFGADAGNVGSVAWWWFCSVPGEAPLLALTRATTLVAGVFVLGSGGTGTGPSAASWGTVAGAMMSTPSPGIGALTVRGLGHLATEALSFA